MAVGKYVFTFTLYIVLGVITVLVVWVTSQFVDYESTEGYLLALGILMLVLHFRLADRLDASERRQREIETQLGSIKYLLLTLDGRLPK